MTLYVSGFNNLFVEAYQSSSILSSGTSLASRKYTVGRPYSFSNLISRGSFEQIQVSPVYFDREDVKRAIHAPENVTWSECSNIDVFLHNNDESLPSGLTVLPKIIEKSERSVIVHGLADYILIAEGSVVCTPRSLHNADHALRT